MSLRIKAIVAMSRNRVIGADGKIPWHITEDLKRFKELTSGHIVLMGRKTYETLPSRYRPLPNRRNVVVTKIPDFGEEENIDVFNDPINAVKVLSAEPDSAEQTLWIIGGGEIYRATQSLWDEVHLTLVNTTVVGDTTFPEFEAEFTEKSKEVYDGFTFFHYVR